MIDDNSPHSALNIIMTRRTVRALTLLMNALSDSVTDTVNRAIQLYSYITYVLGEGGDVIIRQPGEPDRSLAEILRGGEVPGEAQ